MKHIQVPRQIPRALQSAHQGRSTQLLHAQGDDRAFVGGHARPTQTHLHVVSQVHFELALLLNALLKGRVAAPVAALPSNAQHLHHGVGRQAPALGLQIAPINFESHLRHALVRVHRKVNVIGALVKRPLRDIDKRLPQRALAAFAMRRTCPLVIAHMPLVDRHDDGRCGSPHPNALMGQGPAVLCDDLYKAVNFLGAEGGGNQQDRRFAGIGSLNHRHRHRQMR